MVVGLESLEEGAALCVGVGLGRLEDSSQLLSRRLRVYIGVIVVAGRHLETERRTLLPKAALRWLIVVLRASHRVHRGGPANAGVRTPRTQVLLSEQGDLICQLPKKKGRLASGPLSQCTGPGEWKSAPAQTPCLAVARNMKCHRQT